MSDVFEAQRQRLTAVAYGMLGQLMDAEDVVQDAYLRWRKTDRASVDNPTAFLTTVTTRLAIDRLRSAQRRRETYVGTWLPEPVVREADPGDIVADAERISLAFLTALERLNPIERAVLLLRDVFDLDYGDVANVIDRSPTNCRQIAARAREHVGDDGRSVRRSTEREQELLAAFVAAMGAGDVDQLTRTLADDVTLWSDGGGKARAARHPILGVDRVARFLMGIRKNGRPGDRMGFVTANGDPAIYMQRDGAPFALTVLRAAESGIVGVHSVLNPDKLAHLDTLDAPFVVTLDGV